MTLTRTTLGTASPLIVSSMGLGCMGMSEFYGTPDEQGGLDTIHRALDLGVTFLDTADMYGPFTNEQLVGPRHRGAARRGAAGHQVRHPSAARTASASASTAAPDYVRQACDASLQRLGVDHIDLYYQHRVDKSVPIEETVGAMKELVEAGKVAHLGLSEAGPDTIRRAHAVHPITALQTEYSLFTRDLEDDVLPVHHASSASGWSPTPRSAAACSPAPSPATPVRTARATDAATSYFPRFQGEALDANLALVEKVRALADEKGCTPGQLALAWVLAQGSRHGIALSPIPGTKRVVYLEENVGAADVELTDDDLAALERAVPRDAVAGDRYGDMSAIDA